MTRVHASLPVLHESYRWSIQEIEPGAYWVCLQQRRRAGLMFTTWETVRYEEVFSTPRLPAVLARAFENAAGRLWSAQQRACDPTYAEKLRRSPTDRRPTKGKNT